MVIFFQNQSQKYLQIVLPNHPQRHQMNQWRKRVWARASRVLFGGGGGLFCRRGRERTAVILFCLIFGWGKFWFNNLGDKFGKINVSKADKTSFMIDVQNQDAI